MIPIPEKQQEKSEKVSVDSDQWASLQKKTLSDTILTTAQQDSDDEYLDVWVANEYEKSHTPYIKFWHPTLHNIFEIGGGGAGVMVTPQSNANALTLVHSRLAV